MSNEMIEKVAKAIKNVSSLRIYGMYDYSSYKGNTPPHVIRRESDNKILWQSTDKEKTVEMYEKLCSEHIAKAAIAAMREPTNEMIKIGLRRAPMGALAIPSEIYQAMIDAALKE